MVARDDHRTDAAFVPKVNVRSIQTHDAIVSYWHVHRMYEPSPVKFQKNIEGNIDLPANASAANFYSHLARIQAFPGLHIGQRRSRFCDPEVMVGVGEDTNVRLLEIDCSHGG